MSNPCFTQLTLEGSGGWYTPNQPVNATLTLTNPTASTINVTSIAPYATCNSQPYSGVVFGTPTTIGNVKAVPPGGQLTYSFGFVLTAPQGSAENQAAQGNAAAQAVTIAASVYTDDSNVLNPSVTLTPQMYGTAAPAAAGQFLYASPLDAANWFFFP